MHTIALIASGNYLFLHVPRVQLFRISIHVSQEGQYSFLEDLLAITTHQAKKKMEVS